ncbi:unnamed protein product [Spirodela intermedia]|uniref:Uncharacterized protein n=1 Tax=Spirodela intermedia TaxID=51605 RepID=A0A7I8JPG4_SPIIN|nr:unnamed protein product [Spirodela intermedia]CAA6671332.1 unnamed protein product [Spirodela intermedia]
MEETGWEERVRAVTHLLTSPPSEVAAPPLHSQVFLAATAPSYLLRATPLLLSWSVAFFLSSLGRHRPYAASWRSKCPFQEPPPLVVSAAVEPAPPRRTPEEMRTYFRRRLRRRRPGVEVPALVAVVGPNMLLFSLLLWDPLSLRQEP